MLNLLILIPVCLILAGCPSRRIQIAPDTPPFLAGHSRALFRLRIRAVLLIEHLDEEHARIIRDLTRTVREEPYRLNVDVLALFAATVKFGELVALRGDPSFTRLMLHYSGLARLAMTRESPFRHVWDSNREIMNQVFPHPKGATRCFETIITFVFHPEIPLHLRIRVSSIFRQAWLILQASQTHFDRMRREVFDPLVFTTYDMIWNPEVRPRDFIATTEQLEHFYSTLIGIVRDS